MRLNAAVLVGPGDLRVRRLAGLLTCLRVHTGACVCLYDPVVRAAGMAHVLDAHSGLHRVTRPGSYADTALAELTESLERVGAQRKRLVAALVGGAEIRLTSDGDDLILQCDAMDAVIEALTQFGIPIFGREVGGRAERTAMLDVATGRVRVRQGFEDRLVCVLGASVSPVAAA